MTEIHNTEKELNRMLDQASEEAKEQISDEELQNRLGQIRFQFTDKEGDKTQAIVMLSNLVLDTIKVLTNMEQDEIYIYEKGIYIPNGERIIAQYMERGLGLSDVLTTHRVNEVIGHVKRLTMTRDEYLQENPNLICLENGILDLTDLSIHSHSSEHFFRNRLPIKYSEERDCLEIKKFLKEIIHTDQIARIQELAGYCLYKKHNIQKAFMFVGGGGNGKSTLINLLKSFLGHENCSSEPLHSLETNRFAVYSLYGKLANMFADLPARALSQTAIFKMLTGEDPVPVERKFKDRFNFTNHAKLIFSCNQIPKSPDGTDAFFRRWIIINFPNQFLGKEANKNLLKKLTSSEELSGFLNFALEGLKRLLENEDFSDSESVDEVREEYIRKSDSVVAFEMDYVLVAPDEFVKKKELYTAYCDYCREREYPVEAENIFHRRLQEAVRVEDYRPILEEDGKKLRVQCWKGIKLEKNPDSPDKVDQMKLDVNGVKDVKVNSLLNYIRDNPEENAEYIDNYFDPKLVKTLLEKGDICKPKYNTYQILE